MIKWHIIPSRYIPNARSINMKCTTSLLAILFLFSYSASAQTSRELIRDKPPAQSAARTALVIGNGQYADSPLRNPPNDAADMAEALRSLGFEVLSFVDLDQIGMKRAIRDFGTKLRAKGGVGLFYYAGHGVQSKGVNYLIPVGAKVDTEEELEYESVQAGFVLAQMESAKNAMNIVILDACRNNPFARSFRSAEKGLASIDAPSGTILAYSTAPGSVASDGAGRNGLYTQELLKQIKTPGLSIEEVFKQVRIHVRGATTEKQTPWEVSSLVGDFYFAGKPVGGAATAAPLDILPIISERLPTADELLSDFAKAVGSNNANGTTSLVMNSKVEGESQGKKWTVAIKSYIRFPDYQLSESRYSNGVVVKYVRAGNQGWRFQSGSGTKEMSAEMINSAKLLMAINLGDIGFIKSYYKKITVIGREKLGDRDVYVVEFLRSDNKSERRCFGIVDKLIYKWGIMTQSPSNEGVLVPAEIFFDDYINVNGLQVPLKSHQKDPTGEMFTTVDYSSIKFNVPLDDKLFRKP